MFGIQGLLNRARYLEACLKGAFFKTLSVDRGIDRLLMLQGRMASWKVRECESINDLSDVEFKVYSQWGEDGIIDWLVERIQPQTSAFIEFGVENYREANTRFLLENRNWRGLIMDGSAEHMASVRAEELYWRYDLTAASHFITRENVDDLFREHGFAGNLGLLSIDIDGNDYWVLEAIESVSAELIAIEYNPVLGDLHPIVVPYNPSFNRFDAHHSGLYFGASIAAVRRLCEQRGYLFAGTCSNGINAFFVREDRAAPVRNAIRNFRAYPSRHRDSRNDSGDLSFSAGLERFALIKHLPVCHVESGEEVVIGSLGDLYSQQWLDAM